MIEFSYERICARRVEKSKNSPLKIDGPHVLLIIDSQRNNDVFAHFLCSFYREAYLPLGTPFKFCPIELNRYLLL